MTDDTAIEPDKIEGAPHPRETVQLIGQSQAEADFLSAFNTGRLHHAWTITGPRGIGKATLAWKIARFILNQPTNTDDMFTSNAPTNETLDTDINSPISRRIQSLSEPRLFLCRRPWDDKAKRHKRDITVEEIRALKSFFNLSATDGGWRVVIIDTADDMNNSSANALLKILEEPPEKTIILLISHQPARLLPTIRSRCRELRCQKLAPEKLSVALQNAGFGVDENSATLAELSGGSVGEAIRILSANGLTRYAELVQLIGQTPSINRPLAVKFANACAGKNNEAVYDLTLQLIQQLLARLARFAALQPSTMQEAAIGEATMLSKMGPDASSARQWAELSTTLTARTTHARAVNLDPSLVILDMLFKINETAQKIAV